METARAVHRTEITARAVHRGTTIFRQWKSVGELFSSRSTVVELTGEPARDEVEGGIPESTQGRQKEPRTVLQYQRVSSCSGTQVRSVHLSARPTQPE